MTRKKTKGIAAATVAVILFSLLLPSCKGRRMTDMVPTGETVTLSIDTITPHTSPTADTQQQ